MRIEPFQLERWMTTYETQVRYDIAESGILPLTTADLLGFEPPATRADVMTHITGMQLGYSEARGSLELRTLLAETYQNCTPDNILVTTGAIEANFLLFHMLLNPGDHIIAPYPAYQQLYSVPRAIGCDVSMWRLRPEKQFCYDLAELETMVTPAHPAYRRQLAAQPDRRNAHRRGVPAHLSACRFSRGVCLER
ncbi:MAG: aminotransferase class I/II-fold pyridoxal phosphate-dependent enzyme [Chloroflexaceae bacterium]|nr:aminotransferase class I/II-fold pyridoxal phosphate-dependent enzyme [Chloroflexaceae bacterium]